MDMGTTKPTTLQIASATALVSLLIAGVAGYFFGYYQGRQDMRLQVRGAFENALTGGGNSLSSDHPIAPPEPVWDVSEDKSPVDDSPTVTLSIAASKAPVNSIGGQRSARLIIRCKEHSTDLFVALDEYLGTDTTSVVYRIDDMPSQTDSWSKSTDGKAVFAGDPVALARRLAIGSKFFARVSDFQGTTYDVEFKTSGLAKELPRVAKACDWK